MNQDRYIWLVWSSAFLLPWLAAYGAFPRHRITMRWTSLLTMPLGLTEPLFVPAYWNPPSLFDLAQKTGFDVESLIFSFGIGGIGAVLYDLMTGLAPRDVPADERAAARHRFHSWALATPFVAFPILYLFGWNPIYPAIAAMILGAIAAILCRPDLLRRTWLGAVLFLGYYTLFLLGLEISAPGYIGRVWNLAALSGLSLAGIPAEEFMFAAAFGAYWAGVYEHVTWRTAAPAA